MDSYFNVPLEKSSERGHLSFGVTPFAVKVDIDTSTVWGPVRSETSEAKSVAGHYGRFVK